MTVNARDTLVIHRGGLGDLLGAVPALRALRAAWPGAAVELVTHPERGGLLRCCGLVDRVRAAEDAALLPLFAGDAPAAPTRQWAGSFARAVAWVRDPDGALGRGLHACGVGDVLIAEPFGTDRPHAAHLLGMLAPWGLDGPPDESPLRVHADAAAEGDAWLDAHGLGGDAPLVAIHPGSGSPRKNWPAAAFLEVARALAASEAVRVLVVLGPAEAEGELHHVPWREAATAVAPELSLPALAAVAARCALWLGNDAGTTHLAAMLGTPTVALYGSASVPAVWAPRGPRVTLLRAHCGPGAHAPPREVRAVLEAARRALSA